MLQNYLTTKQAMRQAWTKDGKRQAITVLKAESVVVTAVKTTDKDGYNAVQIGLGSQKPSRLNKPQTAYYQKLKLTKMPRLTRELKVDSEFQASQADTLTQPFAVGDIVSAKGTTKGKGFTGVVKRYGFSGGPKTHGQSDRLRAPGSIGQGTDPGRVHRGKRMAGHSGHNTRTITNLTVVHLDEATQEVWISGSVPGHRGSLVLLQKTGHNDKFSGLNLPTTQAIKDDQVATQVEPEKDAEKSADQTTSQEQA